MVEKQQLGKNGPGVGRLGYGAMVLEGFYGNSDAADAVDTIHRALDIGCNMIDSADAYGSGHNESLLGRALLGRRDDAFLATKFGIVFDETESGTELPTGWGFALKINGTPPYVKRALDASLKRLGTEVIDLWYAHYLDPARPVEETVGAMAEVVTAGKVRYLGLCNVTADEVRRAHAVHPLAANRNRFAPLKAIAGQLGITPAQLALSWLLHQGNDIFPIPGTRHAARVKEYTNAAMIELSLDVLRQSVKVAPPGAAVGGTLL